MENQLEAASLQLQHATEAHNQAREPSQSLCERILEQCNFETWSGRAKITTRGFWRLEERILILF